MEIKTTLGINRTVSSVYRPSSIDELKLEYASKVQNVDKVSIFSSGKNWGYGCHAPNQDGSLLIDLSGCNRILHYDQLHGLVTLEPGVTFGQLAVFLEEKGSEWIAPVIGGGPACSVVGNALERGYGITPKTDHFGAITQLEAILKNGEIYQGALTRLGLPKLDKLFKYGIGPYFDGIFSQSGIGIVTQMTISLAQKPSYVEAFYFLCKNESDLERIVEISRTVKKDLGDIVGGINILNRERVLSMLIEYPEKKKISGERLSEEELSYYAKKFNASPWLVFGALYGEKSIVQAASKTIKKRFRPISKKSIYFNTSNRLLFKALANIFRIVGVSGLATTLDKMEMGFQVLMGTPDTVALKLAYWMHSNKNLVTQKDLNPNRDGCGLIWYSPLVEFKSEEVRKYVDFMNESSKKFGMNSLITLTTIDAKCFDSTVPILFNMDSPEQVKRANDFYEYLLEEGAKLGFFPYRLTIDSQKKYKIQNVDFGIQTINSTRYK